MLMRSLNKTEKLMLLVVVILLLAALYFLLVHQPVQNRIQELNGQMEEQEIKLQAATVKAKKYMDMKNALEKSKAQGGELAYVPDYDNEVELLAELHNILSGMKPKLENPIVEFNAEDRIAIRSIHFTFTAPDYAQARERVEALSHTKYRSLMDSLSIAPSEDGEGDIYWMDAHRSEGPEYIRGIHEGPQQVTGTITFYEMLSKEQADALKPAPEPESETESGGEQE